MGSPYCSSLIQAPAKFSDGYTNLHMYILAFAVAYGLGSTIIGTIFEGLGTEVFGFLGEVLG